MRDDLRVVIIQNVSLEGHLALSTYLRNIASHLARQDGMILSLIAQKGDVIQRHLPFRFFQVEGDTYSIWGNVRFCLAALRELVRMDREGGVDLIHCVYPFSSLAAAALFKTFFSRDTKVIYDLRSPWIENSMKRLGLQEKRTPLRATLYRKLAYTVERILCRWADGFVMITEGLKEHYSKSIPLGPKPIMILPSGVDTILFRPPEEAISSHFRRLYGIGDDDFVLGHVGALNRERELGFLIRLVKELAMTEKDGKRHYLLLVGNGDARKELAELSRKLGVVESVIFVGEVKHEEVPSYIRSLDASVCHLPDDISFRYSFPMKILEYAACGVPVFASRIPAHVEISKHIPVTLYDPEDPSDLAEKIRSGSGIRATMEQVRRFSWESLALELAGFIRRVCSE